MSSIPRKQYSAFGEWRDSRTDKWMPVTDASTGETIALTPSCTRDEVLEAIRSAKEAFTDWSHLSLAKRAQMMFHWRNVLMQHLDELTVLCAREVGKNLNEARGDVLKAIEPTEFAAALPYITQGSASLQVTTGFDTATYRMPLGVVAGIIPFNFPAMIPWLGGAAGYRHGQHRGAQGIQRHSADLHAHLRAILHRGRLSAGHC